MPIKERSDWGRLDAAASPDCLLAFLDAFAALPLVAAAKRRSFELIGPEPGDRVLDAGCGTGADAAALLERVCPGGEVVGADASEIAVLRARHRWQRLRGLRFECADLRALPFADSMFDAVRADRTLVHVPEPTAAVSELARVTRPGGRVALTEAVFENSTSEGVGQSPEREVRHVLAFLPFLLHKAGVADIVVDASTGDVDLDTETADILGARSSRVTVRIVHVAGVVVE